MLFLARHGETIFNSQSRLQGRKDSDLTAKGLGQARALRDYLAKQRIDLAFSSDLGRAVKTAESILELHSGVQWSKLSELREISYGPMDGLDRQEIDMLFPGKWLERMENRWKFRLGDSENYLQLEERVKPFTESLKRLIKSKNVLVVGHTNTNRMVLGLLLGLQRPDIERVKQEWERLYIVEPAGKQFKAKNVLLPQGKESLGLVFFDDWCP